MNRVWNEAVASFSDCEAETERVKKKKKMTLVMKNEANIVGSARLILEQVRGG